MAEGLGGQLGEVMSQINPNKCTGVCLFESYGSVYLSAEVLEGPLNLKGISFLICAPVRIAVFMGV